MLATPKGSFSPAWVRTFHDPEIAEMARVAGLLGATMATTWFWVSGSGTWDGTTTTNWALTSGGAGGAGVPGTADTVVFDGNSGTGSVTVNAGNKCANFICDGSIGSGVYTGAFVAGTSGSVFVTTTGTCSWFLPATMGALPVGPEVSGTGTLNIKTNGTSMHGLGFGSSTCTVVLNDTNTIAGVVHSQGTLNTNGQLCTWGSYSSTGPNVRTLTQGGSLITLTGTGTVWTISGTNYTLSAAPSSTIIIANTASTAKTFAGGGMTYHNLQIATGTGTVTITGANTFDKITCTSTPLVLPAATTTALTSGAGWRVTGSSVSSSTSGTPATISCPSGIVIGASLTLKDSTATGGAAFWTPGGTFVSDVTGWNVGTPSLVGTVAGNGGSSGSPAATSVLAGTCKATSALRGPLTAKGAGRAKGGAFGDASGIIAATEGLMGTVLTTGDTRGHPVALGQLRAIDAAHGSAEGDLFVVRTPGKVAVVVEPVTTVLVATEPV